MYRRTIYAETSLYRAMIYGHPLRVNLMYCSGVAPDDLVPAVELPSVTDNAGATRVEEGRNSRFKVH